MRKVISLVGALVLLLAVSVPASAAPDKVTICHVPSGNPGNTQVLSVGPAALPAHLAHGDSLGDCAVCP